MLAASCDSAGMRTPHSAWEVFRVFLRLGLTLFGVDLYFATAVHLREAPVGLAQFLADSSHWRMLADLTLIGVFGGFYIVPLYALIQSRSEPHHRSRIIAGNNILNALFMVAQPLSIACGSILSGYIMQMNGVLGLAGWRWLFIIEGVPSIVLGVVTFFYLQDEPRQARWLSDGERDAIAAAVAAESPDTAGARVWSELGSRSVVLLCLSYFGLVSTLNTNATWVPQIVREILGGPADFLRVGVWTAIPAIITMVAMPLWSARSDRRDERLWHVRVPMALAALGWVLVVMAASPLARFAGLTLVSIGAFCGMAIFWTLPAAVLSPAARPASSASRTRSAWAVMSLISCGPIIGSLKPGKFSISVVVVNWPPCCMPA